MYLRKAKSEIERDGVFILGWEGFWFNGEKFIAMSGRPEFSEEVQATFQGVHDDICHSISWYTMKKAVQHYINHCRAVEDVLCYIDNFNNIFGVLSTQYIDNTENNEKKYIKGAQWKDMAALFADMKYTNPVNFQNISKRIVPLMELWFSALCNLRPLNRRNLSGYSINGNWNRSVGTAYDPREWVYIDKDQRICNAYTGEDFGPYGLGYTEYEFAGNEWTFPEPLLEGFYLLNNIDHFILTKLLGMGVSSGWAGKPVVWMFTGEDQNYRYLASSSNQMEKPEKWGECLAPIFYLDISEDVWRNFIEPYEHCPEYTRKGRFSNDLEDDVEEVWEHEDDE